MSYVDEFAAQLVIFEGRVPWMYLDTRGNVTVDVGVMLPTVAAAMSLKFVTGGRLASNDEVASDYVRVKGMSPGRVAGHYVCGASPRLLEAIGNAMLWKRVAGIDVNLTAAIDGYEKAPATAKLALLDMAYNLGVEGLQRDYPHLLAAVKAGDFARASQCCHRIGPSEARNAWTAKQFELAAANAGEVAA